MRDGTVRTPLRVRRGGWVKGVLRLRGLARFASQPTPLRMTGFHFISTASVFVVSFPKMSITFTTTV